MGIEKVDRKDEPRNQERHVRMDDRCNVENPPGKKKGEEFGKPEHQPRKPDGEHSAENAEKIEFLPIGPAIELRFRPSVKKPLDHPNDVPNILAARAERIRTKKSLKEIWISGDLLEKEKVDDVDDCRPEIREGKTSADPVNEAGSSCPSQKMHETARPGGLGEF